MISRSSPLEVMALMRWGTDPSLPARTLKFALPSPYDHTDSRKHPHSTMVQAGQNSRIATVPMTWPSLRSTASTLVIIAAALWDDCPLASTDLRGGGRG
jgi:hypothetical protein